MFGLYEMMIIILMRLMIGSVQLIINYNDIMVKLEDGYDNNDGDDDDGSCDDNMLTMMMMRLIMIKMMMMMMSCSAFFFSSHTLCIMG